jgi:hypothetical protein
LTKETAVIATRPPARLLETIIEYERPSSTTPEN